MYFDQVATVVCCEFHFLIDLGDGWCRSARSHLMSSQPEHALRQRPRQILDPVHQSRAASMAAFNASRLVCSAISLMMLVTLLMFFRFGFKIGNKFCICSAPDRGSLPFFGIVRLMASLPARLISMASLVATRGFSCLLQHFLP